MGCHFFLPKAIWCGQKIKKNKKKIRPRKVEWLFQGPTAYWGLKTVFQCQVQGILNYHITDLWHKDIRPTLDSSSLVFSAWACFKSLSISSIRAIFEVLALKKTQKPFKNTGSYWCLIRYTHTHTHKIQYEIILLTRIIGLMRQGNSTLTTLGESYFSLEEQVQARETTPHEELYSYIRQNQIILSVSSICFLQRLEILACRRPSH